MKHVTLFCVLTYLCTLWPTGLAVAAEAEKLLSCKIKLQAEVTMEVQNEKHVITADTQLHYTWSTKGRERTVTLDLLGVKAGYDQVPLMNMTMEKQKLLVIENGMTNVITAEEASPETKKVLEDTFGNHLCRIQIDEHGMEFKREVSSRPGAQDMVKQGMVANTLLFHPPFPKNTNSWQVDGETSMGDGGFAKGKLAYQKTTDSQHLIVCNVSGTLTNKVFVQPSTGLVMRDVSYVVTGQQTYDVRRAEWTSGKLRMDITSALEFQDKPIGKSKGFINATFETVPSHK